MKIIIKFRRMWRKTRAVSPVIAAILLIGLAVLAGSAVTFIVLPFIQGNANLDVSAVTGIDQNGDSRVDRITVNIINSGTSADTFDLQASSLTGALNWATTTADGTSLSSAEIGGIDIVFETSNVQDQLSTTDSWTITIGFGTSDDIVITNTDIEVILSAKVITNSNLEISDFTDANWMVTNTGNLYVSHTFNDDDANRESTGGEPGVIIKTEKKGNNVYLVQSNLADAITTYNGATNSNTETQVWKKDVNPVVGFYISLSNPVDKPKMDVKVYFQAFSGSNAVGTFFFDLNTILSPNNYNTNEWVLVLLDFSDSSIWSTSYTSELQAADSVGGFAIRIENDEMNNWDIRIDDIFVASGL